MHGFKGPARMHQDQPGSSIGRDIRKLRFPAKTRDVVHDLGPGLDRSPRNLSLCGVDRNRNVKPLSKILDHWNDTLNLRHRRDRLASRTRRFSADIDDIGPFGDHPFCMFGRGLAGGKAAAIREAVGRYV